MRELFFVAPNEIEWRDSPDRRLEADTDALVRPLAVTRCDLDYAIVTGLTGWKGPFGLGHEMVGEVVDQGDGVTHVKPGDRVIVPFQISCGVCGPCRRGLTGCCDSVPFRSSYGMAPLAGIDYGGALSDMVRVPFADHMLVPLPGGISLAAAAGIADNVSDGYSCVAPYLETRPGARVLVVGGAAQGIGIYAAQAAQALGAEEVAYYDSDPQRLALARTLGITVNEMEPGRKDAPGSRYPITVDASASVEGLAIAIRSTAYDGICHRCYGDLVPETPVPLAHMYSFGMALRVTRVHARAMMPSVVGHVCSGALHPEAVITRRVPFADAAEAILDADIKTLFVADGVDADAA